jgi:hypothetical protein
MEGAAVLNEFRGDVGLKLWQIVRDVRLWAEVLPEHRLGLFRGTAAAPAERLEEISDPALLDSLALLQGELAEPSSASAEVMATECLRISEYAEGKERLGTAVLFAMAASFAAPQRAAPAYEAGRLSLAWKDEVRAETWLRRAIGLARRGGERGTYCRSLILLADLYAARGEGTRAGKYYAIGMRASRRFGMRQARGEAALGLLRLALAAGNHEQADKLQVIASRAFGWEDRRTPEVVRLFARIRIDSGERTSAGEALQRLLPSLENDDDRMAAYALLARANADPGSPWRIAEPWHAAWALIEARPGSWAHVRALIDLALSSIAIGSAERTRAAYDRIGTLSPVPDPILQRDYDRVRDRLSTLDRQRGHR